MSILYVCEREREEESESLLVVPHNHKKVLPMYHRGGHAVKRNINQASP